MSQVPEFWSLRACEGKIIGGLRQSSDLTAVDLFIELESIVKAKTAGIPFHHNN